MVIFTLTPGIYQASASTLDEEEVLSLLMFGRTMVVRQMVGNDL